MCVLYSLFLKVFLLKTLSFCFSVIVFLTHPQVFPIFLNYFFENNFFLLLDKNDSHTTRVYVQNSQIGIPLLWVNIFRHKFFFQFSSINLSNTISNPKTVYILRISSSSSTKKCDILSKHFYNFPLVLKNRNFWKKIAKFRYFYNYRKIRN